MSIREVQDSKSEKEFHQLPFQIYKNDPHWIPHLKQDVEKVFDPQKNKFFRHGRIKRWIMEKDGKTIGRIAAFIDERKNKKEGKEVGVVGFFECINEKEAAFALFDTAKQWLEDEGMIGMDGPINFGEKDNFWVLLIQNFDYPP